MKILIIGDGRHGKDTVAELIAENTGLTFRSSSHFANERAVFPVLQGRYGYDSPEQCYEDRVNHRQEWKDLIAEYCQPADRLAREMLEEADIYVGLRHRREFESARSLFDVIIWVDASERLPGEPTNDLSADDADILVGNDGSLSDLKSLMPSVCRAIGSYAP